MSLGLTGLLELIGKLLHSTQYWRDRKQGQAQNETMEGFQSLSRITSLLQKRLSIDNRSFFGLDCTIWPFERIS